MHESRSEPKCGVWTLGDIVLHRFIKKTPLTYEKPVLSAQFCSVQNTVLKNKDLSMGETCHVLWVLYLSLFSIPQG